MKKLLKLFFTFFKIGLFTFGGGYAMIAQIKEVIVEKNKWLEEDELLEIIAISESTPGPIAINMATYIGYKQKKILGSIFSTLGVVLPSLIIIFVISLFLDEFMKNEFVKYAFIGIKACVAFLIIKAGIDMLIKMKRNVFSFIAFIVVLVLMIVFELLSFSFSSIYFILLGGILGIIFYAICSKKKEENE